MDIKPSAVSWKKTTEDIILREWVHSHSNVSGFIKDILRKAYNEENSKGNKKSNIEIKKGNGLIDLGDF